MNNILMIDKFFAQLAFLSLLLVVAKIVTKRVRKRLNLEKADSVLKKLHKPAGILTVFAGIIHMICSFRGFGIYSIWAYIFGMISILSIILAIYMFMLNKRMQNKWLICHRMFSAIAVISLVLHLALR